MAERLAQRHRGMADLLVDHALGGDAQAGATEFDGHVVAVETELHRLAAQRLQHRGFDIVMAIDRGFERLQIGADETANGCLEKRVLLGLADIHGRIAPWYCSSLQLADIFVSAFVD